jgi:uncharacterized protein YuzE
VGDLKIRYSSDADILLIEFKEGTPVDSIDLKEGIILHLDSEGNPIEMEILDASTTVSMDEFHIQIPTIKEKAAAAHA